MPDALRETLQTTLGASYTIERELGGGGMSRIFVADDVTLGRKIVVKIIAPELAEGVSIERFMREVKVAARLQQANIVPVITAGNATGLPFYTMPYVDGLSLRARLQHGPLPIGEAVNILRDVARALAYAHANGVVHRDIKPENILLSGGAAVVTDFGIAKALSASRTQELSTTGATNAGLTRAGMSLGTPAYMSPEQAAGDPDTDHRADLYAWGVVAWELLVGTHPFARSTTPHAMIAAHMRDTAPAIGTQRPDVPPALAALVSRSMEKNPDLRPGSASEVMEAIDAVGTPTHTNATSPRRTALWAAVATAVIIAAGMAYVASRRTLASTANPLVANSALEKSLAVLPFASVGGDTANAYFAEGIADELTTALARLPGLRLAGRSSAARYKQRGAGTQEIGAALKVGAVLDGTVRRAGDRIRVSAELTNTGDGRVIWKESYQRELKDVFAVQDDITKAIVSALRVQLAGGRGGSSRSSQGTSNPDAYDLYLRGLQAYRKRGPALVQAERYLTQAIALDSNFARAHATLASVLMVTPYFFDTPMADVLPRARAAATRAVALDDAMPEAHMALGHVHTEAFEWKEAESELRRALALDPNRAEVPFRLGFMLMASGRVRESIPAFEQAKAADPLYSTPAIYLAWALALAGHPTEGVAEARRALDLDPANEAIGNVYANTLSLAGLHGEAVVFARKMALLTKNPRRLGFYGWVLGAGGAHEDVRAILRKVEALPPNTWGRYSSLTYLYLAAGDTARALNALDSAVARGGDLVLAQAISSPRFDPFRGKPRFAAAMRRLNLDLSIVTAPDGGRSR